MTSLHHVCPECSSQFTIKYDDEQTESDPQNCPFCGAYILEDMDRFEDEDE
jgi:DNA-directed RNA polymerase subunit RPC12/RpoP